MSVVRVLLVIVCSPLIAALAYNLFSLIIRLGSGVTLEVVPFWIGIGGYFLFQGICARPVKTYVFGHELTHALAGILSGARLKSFKVSARGGSVVLTKTSLWIALAPYFVPIYTTGIVLLYWALTRIAGVSGFYPFFLFAVGFSLAFHYALTHFALAQGQSDLKQFGPVFSGAVIVVVNCVVLLALFKLLFPAQVGIRPFAAESFRDSVAIGRYLYNGASIVWGYFR